MFSFFKNRKNNLNEEEVEWSVCQLLTISENIFEIKNMKITLNELLKTSKDSVFLFNFTVDLNNLGYEDSGDASETCTFLLNIQSGEVLYVDQQIADGNMNVFLNADQWYVSGQGFTIGYDTNEDDEMDDLNEGLTFEEYEQFKDYFLTSGNFNLICQAVCDLSREEDLNSITDIEILDSFRDNF